MRVITLDVETAWAADYSLSKMSALEYVMDERFELQLMSIKFDDHPTAVCFGDDPDLPKVLKKIDWSAHAVCCHNVSFDATVLAYRYNIKPRMWMCTASMARPLHAKTCGVSLRALVEHYKLGVKDSTALMNTKGRRLVDFTPEERQLMGEYNLADTDQCRALFHKLKPHYNASELWQIDALTRMRTEPQFEVDCGLLEQAASVERSRKFDALFTLAKKLGIAWDNEEHAVEQVREQLASAPKFAALLESLDVEVPMKPSPTDPSKQIPALSKTDEAFTALQDHEDPVVAAAARCRLDVKSTLLETRINKFLVAGWLAGEKLPIPLRYCGADTSGRDSGEEYNPQNMPRIGKKPRVSDALRNSLCAPRGKKVIVADQSGIELRVNHFLWQVPFTMQVYGEDANADLYRMSGAQALGIAPEDLTAEQRQMEKVKALGLGFGAGPKTFQRIAKVMGGIKLDEQTAFDAVCDWRMRHDEIVKGWAQCGRAIEWIDQGRELEVDSWGLVHTCAEGFVLPSGRLIRYPDLHKEQDGEWPDGRSKSSWFYGQGRHKARITGPKATENIVQALARDTVFDASVEFYKRTRLYPALRVHDELVYVVPEDHAQELLDELQRVLATPPKWWPQLVVSSSGGIGSTYGNAKQ